MWLAGRAPAPVSTLSVSASDTVAVVSESLREREARRGGQGEVHGTQPPTHPTGPETEPDGVAVWLGGWAPVPVSLLSVSVSALVAGWMAGWVLVPVSHSLYVLCPSCGLR